MPQSCSAPLICTQSPAVPTSHNTKPRIPITAGSWHFTARIHENSSGEETRCTKMVVARTSQNGQYQCSPKLTTQSHNGYSIDFTLVQSKNKCCSFHYPSTILSLQFLFSNTHSISKLCIGNQEPNRMLPACP